MKLLSNVTALLLPASLYAASIHSGGGLKVVTWNVNSDPRIEDARGFAADTHKAWSFESRLPRLVETIKILDADILGLQELSKATFEMLQPFVENLGYTVLKHFHNSSERSPLLMGAFKSNRFEVLESTSRYYKKGDTTIPLDRSDPNFTALTPEAKSAFCQKMLLGEEFERSSQQVAFRDTKTGRTIVFSNDHFALRRECRIESSKLNVQFIQEFKQKYDEFNPVVVSLGDFNTLPSRGGEEQLEILRASGLVEISADAHFTDGSISITDKVADSAFCFYPYDFGYFEPSTELARQNQALVDEVKNPNLGINEKREKINNFFRKIDKPLGGKVDHVFASGYKNVYSSEIFVNPMLESLSGFGLGLLSDKAEIMEFIMTQCDQGTPAFPSDHFPTVIVLEI